MPTAIEHAPSAGGVEYLAVDVTDAEQVKTAVDLAVRAGRPLRTLVNCAGIGPSMRILGRKGPHDLAFYAKVVQVNLIGTFNVMTLASEHIAQTPELDDHAAKSSVNTEPPLLPARVTG